MTRKELSQLYYLQKEIRSDEQRLIDLETAATGITATLTGMPSGGRLSDKTAIAAEIADLKAIIQAKRDMCVAHYNQIMRYVAGIDDSMIRQIITLRNLDMLTWRQIAQKIGGGNTEDGVRKAYARFVDKVSEE
jgi:hypothetical protein